MKKELYIIRHGETDFNTKGVVQGRGVDSSLNSKGKKQAQEFFSRYKNEGFEKIYVSSLKRTYQTIAQFDNKKTEIKKYAELDEISWGIHEGKKDGDTFRQFYDILHLWKLGHEDVKIEGGESPLEVQERLKIFIDHAMSGTEEKILICTHGRAMRILLCTLLERPLTEMDLFPHHNLTLYKLNSENGVSQVELFNDISHLNGR